MLNLYTHIYVAPKRELNNANRLVVETLLGALVRLVWLFSLLSRLCGSVGLQVLQAHQKQNH